MLRKNRKVDLSLVITVSIMMAMAIVFKVVSYEVATMRISLFAIPLLIAGLIGGFGLGALAGLGADLIYGIFISSFAFNPFFTLSSILWGVAGGFLRSNNKELSLVKLTIMVILVSILETTINTMGMYIYAYEGILAALPNRLLVMVVKWPIIIAIVNALDERVILPQIRKLKTNI